MGEVRKKYNSDKISKKKYNSDKTFIQISKDLHQQVKVYCDLSNISIREFLEKIIKESL
jgi:predicted HicB family RNase H-like nuclease